VTVPSMCPVRRADVSVRDRGVESVLVVAGQDHPLLLNATARAIWDLCDGQTTLDEMVRAVCEVFAIAPAQAHADVEAALLELARSDLVTFRVGNHAPR
jgi:hypothetical protein